jgi:UDP-2,3-diacylglucosamine hydrolase
VKTLGLIAGSGLLPVSLARHCQSIGRPVFVLRVSGFADPALEAFEGCEIGFAELGKAFSTLRAAGCGAVCFAGGVTRPNLSDLKPDLRGLAALPGAVAAARGGDDGLLTYLLRQFEQEGFVVEGAHEVMDTLTLPAGPLGRVRPGRGHEADIDRAMLVARTIGGLDIGQGAVCCDGLVLAVEAQEGTDAMLRRIVTLAPTIRGAPGRPRGVLAKACKPVQETRIDLPTIGPATIRNAAEAGLAGVAGEAGRVLLVEREAVVQLADHLGLFVVGVHPPDG